MERCALILSKQLHGSRQMSGYRARSPPATGPVCSLESILSRPEATIHLLSVAISQFCLLQGFLPMLQ